MGNTFSTKPVSEQVIWLAEGIAQNSSLYLLIQELLLGVWNGVPFILLLVETPQRSHLHLTKETPKQHTGWESSMGPQDPDGVPQETFCHL